MTEHHAGGGGPLHAARPRATRRRAGTTPVAGLLLLATTVGASALDAAADRFLNTMVDGLRKRVGRQNDDMEILSADRVRDSLVLKVKLLRVSGRPDAAAAAARERQVNAIVCATPYVGTMLASGVTWRYEYFGKDGKPYHTVTIGRCS